MQAVKMKKIAEKYSIFIGKLEEEIQYRCGGLVRVEICIFTLGWAKNATIWALPGLGLKKI